MRIYCGGNDRLRVHYEGTISRQKENVSNCGVLVDESRVIMIHYLCDGYSLRKGAVEEEEQN